MAGFRLPAALRLLARGSDGVRVWWRSRADPDGPRAASGSVALRDLRALCLLPDPLPPGWPDPAPALFAAPVVFDAVGPGPAAHVALRWRRDGAEPELWYQTQQAGGTRQLGLTVAAYLDLALQARGLRGWQELFVAGAGDGSPLDRRWADRFLRRLERLFPDVDLARFEHARDRRMRIEREEGL